MDESRDRIRKLADQLVLEIDSAEQNRLHRYFDDILAFFAILDEVVTGNESATDRSSPDIAPLREDRPAPTLTPAQLAKLGPGYDPDTTLFAIQPVLEKPEKETPEGEDR